MAKKTRLISWVFNSLFVYSDAQPSLTTWFWAQMDTTPLEMEAMIGRTGCHWREENRKIHLFRSSRLLTAGGQFHSKTLSYRDIQQKFSPSPMQDLYQVPDALLPDVEGMLPGRTGHDVFTVAGETAAFPWSPEGSTRCRYKHKISPRGFLFVHVRYDLVCSTCSPSPAASAWVLVHRLCHRSVSPCRHIPW